MAGVSDPEPSVEDARRTHLANERTLLAWWRTGLAAFAVSIAVGRLAPALLHVSEAPFIALGIGYALLGLALVVVGARRDRSVHRQIASGRLEPVHIRVVWGVTAALLILGLATLVLLFVET
jgi:putative membrane protein